MDDWLLSHLACPRETSPLTLRGGRLTCEAGHEHPVVDEDHRVFKVVKTA